MPEPRQQKISFRVGQEAKIQVTNNKLQNVSDIFRCDSISRFGVWVSVSKGVITKANNRYNSILNVVYWMLYIECSILNAVHWM